MRCSPAPRRASRAPRSADRLAGPVAVGALALAASFGLTSCFGFGSPSTAKTPESAPTTLLPIDTALDTTSTSSTTTSTTTTSTTTTTTTTTIAPTTTVAAVPAMAPALRPVYSSGGRETARLQQRLLDLGFWVGTTSGRYELTTRQAVMAFQKYYNLKRSGRVDGSTAAALSVSMPRVQALTTDGDGIEIDKNRQILFVIHEGVTQFVLNASSGSGQYFLEQNQKDPTKWENGRAVTPSGRFTIQRQKSEGWWDGDLGKIYRPKYFNGGRAVHGLSSVPAYPASHGCVRVSIPAMDMLWTLPYLKKGTPVWVYGDDVAPRNQPIPIPPPTTAGASTTASSPPSTAGTSGATGP